MSDEAILIEEVKKLGLEAWDGKPFLEKVTDIAPAIIYVYNQKTNSNEYSNRSLGHSLGYSVEEIQAMGAEMMPRLCHPDDFPNMLVYFEELRALPDGEVTKFEYRMKNRRGGWTWLLSYDTVFDRDEDGSVVRHIGLANDITVQKHAEFRALEQERSALAANNDLRSFAYSVTHDLKSPSNTLNMLLNELRETNQRQDTEAAEKLIDRGLETVERMQAVITDVLAYTKVIGEEATPQETSLNEVLSGVLQDLDADIAASKAVVTVGDLPIVTGNEQQLRVLFQNLISNAIKFHAEGVTPVVEIVASDTLERSGNTVLVKDNGIGLGEQDKAVIFELFGRLNPEHIYPGTGLGLAICHRIVANFGGTIEVTSAPGEGSTFAVQIPKVRARP